MKWEIIYVNYGDEQDGKVQVLDLEYRIEATPGAATVDGSFDLRDFDEQHTLDTLKAMDQAGLLKLLHSHMSPDDVTALERAAARVEALTKAAAHQHGFIPQGADHARRPLPDTADTT